MLINGSTKTLTCSNVTTEDNLIIKNSIVTTFKDDSIKSMEIKGNEQVDSDQADYVDLYFNYKTEELNKYTQIAGVKVTTNKVGNVINYSVVADKSNSEKLFKEEFGGVNINAENFVSLAEASGYKCNVK